MTVRSIQPLHNNIDTNLERPGEELSDLDTTNSIQLTITDS